MNLDQRLKFEDADFRDRDVSSLPDVPSAAGWTAARLKARFDNVAKALVALGKHNDLVDALTAPAGAAGIGARDSRGAEATVQSVLDDLGSGWEGDRVMVSDGDGVLTDSFVTAEELASLEGMSGSIRDRLEGLSGGWTPERVMIADENGDLAVSEILSGELAFLRDCTGNVQAQLDSKPDLEGWPAERVFVSNSYGNLVASSVTKRELEQLTGVTGNLQGQLGEKADRAGYVPERALVTDPSGSISASGATAREVGYLRGVTGYIQSQLDALDRRIDGAAWPDLSVAEGAICVSYEEQEAENDH